MSHSFTLNPAYAEPGPGPSGKADPMPKFTVLAKTQFSTNLRVLISNMTIFF